MVNRSCHCVKVLPCWLTASGFVLLEQSIHHNQLSSCSWQKEGGFFYATPERQNSGQEFPFLVSRWKMSTADQRLSGAITAEPVVKCINSGCLRHVWAESVSHLPAHSFTSFIPQHCSRKGGVLCLYSGDDLQHWLHGGVIVFCLNELLHCEQYN